MNTDNNPLELKDRPLLDKLIGFCLTNKLVVLLVALVMIVLGILVAPFDWNIPGLQRSPTPVDAIPDIGENQQIVFTKWMGRSPQDIEDQIGYPLTVSLLGIPGVKTIRSFSMFGFSSIYVIFKEDVDFYWSRSRVLEKLSSLSPGTLPKGVSPMLGPDATPLGQVFWYTLEGMDKNGNPTGGWDLQELRTAQDWYVRYSLMSADGVAEVASIGGFVKEYQVDVNPDAMRAYGVTLEQVFNAVRMSNMDVGARTIEINRAEYMIRGLGFIKSLEDVEKIVLRQTDNVPVTIKDVATVSFGPALRRGALDKEGTEAVGGVVVVRYGANPLEVIKKVKKKIAEITPGLPKKTLADGTVSQVKIVPFYDRSGLIYETLGTLNSALTEEILITVIVILIMLMHLRSSMIISGLLPMAVLMCFIGMKTFKVDANIVALSGIAIAIGTMVDMGIVLSENILRHLESAKAGDNKIKVIFDASTEVGSAVVTAVATTVVSFLPVFTMTAAEGKLFKPLAYTKTFALIASVIVALTMIPPFAHVLFTGRISSRKTRDALHGLLIIAGIAVAFIYAWWAGVILAVYGLLHFVRNRLPKGVLKRQSQIINGLAVLGITVLLSGHWLPLGPEKGGLRNLVFVGGIIAVIMGGLGYFQRKYSEILAWFLNHKLAFLTIVLLVLAWGGKVWMGLGKEFMPPLDEGSYLFMPTTMPHASIGEAMDILKKQDMAINSIPEVSSVVGKIGRADSPLDPAPVSMIETIINYKPEYREDKNGHRMRFKYNGKAGKFVRDKKWNLVEDKNGRPYRQWRKHIRKPDDIWKEIVKAARIPGTTNAPKLQPIAARIVMLQSGMRAPMGVKVKGPDLAAIEKVGLQIEKFLKEVPSVEPASVIADRIVGKPYLEIKIDRDAIARYGLHIKNVQNVIEVAIGGKPVTSSVEGRERYTIRVRYQRELRNSLETLGEILVPTKQGAQIPLSQLAKIEYARGPQVIKNEDTFLVGYVVFDKKPQYAEVNVVKEAQAFLNGKIKSGEMKLPSGVSYTFAGNYENQVRSEKKLMVVLPLALFVIFMILYFQFKSVPITLLVFSGILVAWAGGFILLSLYAKPWFLNFSVFGMNMQTLFQIHPVNLSVAVWVGFLALFGIATDNGVIIATYLNQMFAKRTMASIQDIRQATIDAAERRIRPCLMTTATTILALIPVLTSTGRGSDVMVPMAIPSFGGMLVVLVSVFVVPVLYSFLKEFQFNHKKGGVS